MTRADARRKTCSSKRINMKTARTLMKKLQYDEEHAEVAAQAAHGKALYFTARRKEFKLRAADARVRLQKVASALIASLTGYHSDGLRLSEGRPNGGLHPSRRQHSAVENGPRPTGSARLLGIHQKAEKFGKKVPNLGFRKQYAIRRLRTKLELARQFDGGLRPSSNPSNSGEGFQHPSSSQKARSEVTQFGESPWPLLSNFIDTEKSTLSLSSDDAFPLSSPSPRYRRIPGSSTSREIASHTIAEVTRYGGQAWTPLSDSIESTNSATSLSSDDVFPLSSPSPYFRRILGSTITRELVSSQASTESTQYGGQAYPCFIEWKNSAPPLLSDGGLPPSSPSPHHTPIQHDTAVLQDRIDTVQDLTDHHSIPTSDSDVQMVADTQGFEADKSCEVIGYDIRSSTPATPMSFIGNQMEGYFQHMIDHYPPKLEGLHSSPSDRPRSRNTGLEGSSPLTDLPSSPPKTNEQRFIAGIYPGSYVLRRSARLGG